MQQADTVKFRHFDVCDHDIKGLGLAALQCGQAVRGALHLKAFAFKINGEQIANAALIINNENFCRLCHGFPSVHTYRPHKYHLRWKRSTCRDLSTLKDAAVSVFQRVGQKRTGVSNGLLQSMKKLNINRLQRKMTCNDLNFKGLCRLTFNTGGADVQWSYACALRNFIWQMQAHAV